MMTPSGKRHLVRVGALVVFFVAILQILSWPAAADDYYRVVHIDCRPDARKVYAKLYTLYQSIPIPEGDMRFLDLANDPRGVVCRLSPRHVIAFHALASARQPENDNLQVMIDSKTQFSLSVDNPFASPSDNYSSSILISLQSDGKLKISETTERDLK